MPRLSPFAGVRYATEDGYLDAVVAPPYDVVTSEQRAGLVSRSEFNAVRLEVPIEEGGRDRYEVAADLWREWRATGVLVTYEEPAFYVYLIGFRDDMGSPR